MENMFSLFELILSIVNLICSIIDTYLHTTQLFCIIFGIKTLEKHVQKKNRDHCIMFLNSSSTKYIIKIDI